MASKFISGGAIPDTMIISATAFTLTGSPVLFTAVVGAEYLGVSAVEEASIQLPLSPTNVGSIFGEYVHELTLAGSRVYVPTGTFGNGFAILDWAQSPASRVETSP